MKSFIENLRSKPYHTRVRILWGTTVAIGLILIVIWIVSLKTTIRNSTGGPVVPSGNSQNASIPTDQFLKIERVEKTTNNLKIYFNLNNGTDDILNVSKIEDITLEVSEGSFHPTTILDRQGQPFVQKVLSKTQVFGIAMFTTTVDESAEIIFDNLFLEKNPLQTFKQKLEMDFSKLNQTSNVRS